MRKIYEFLFDLLVVFVGVFAAFQLSDYKESRKDIHSKVNYYRTFKMELEFIGKQTKALRDTIDQLVFYYESEIEKGNQPELKLHRGFYFQSKAFVVESAFNDAHFSTIGQNFIVSISGGANLFYRIDEHLRNYENRVKDLLYNQPYSSSRFYSNQGLRPEYQWYLDDLKEISKLMMSLIQAIDKGAIPATNQLIQRYDPD